MRSVFDVALAGEQMEFPMSAQVEHERVQGEQRVDGIHCVLLREERRGQEAWESNIGIEVRMSGVEQNAARG